MVWTERVASLTKAQFIARYRLDLDGFNYLLERINHDHKLVRARANVKDQIAPELLLSMFLRWCAGGSYLDIVDLHGVAECHLCRRRWLYFALRSFRVWAATSALYSAVAPTGI